MKQFLLLIYIISQSYTVSAQVINAYAKVDSITFDTLYISHVNEVFDTFEIGEQIMIIQIQDSVIGGNTINNSTFGDLTNIATAGLYEFKLIAGLVEVSGVPTSITLNSSLINNYNTSNLGALQIVSFPKLDTLDATLNTDVEPLAWDGNIGGILAFQVPGKLTIEANITADGKGFRGGSKSFNFYSGILNCNSTPYYSNDFNYGGKGEGIYRNVNPDFSYGRGKILNGGGGGNRDINGGGGGGSNFSRGGEGGKGWLNSILTGCPTSVGGLGGIPLGQYINHDRIFMGGGGGGGQQNNSQASDGGNGGGIIYIKANQIETNCTSGNYKISSNGGHASDSGIDGSGGGGAGGTIVLNVLSWNVLNTCPLTISTNGGDGGNTTATTYHAGGGGGGLGSVIFYTKEPLNNITTNTLPGKGGANCVSCDSAENANGMNKDGIIDTFRILPYYEFDFKIFTEKKEVILQWQYPFLYQKYYFEIDKSQNAIDWASVWDTTLYFSQIHQKASFRDTAPFQGNNLYRLKVRLQNGKFIYSKIRRAFYESPLQIYPNPAKSYINITGKFTSKIKHISMIDIYGKEYKCHFTEMENGIKLHIQSFSPGTYFLSLNGLHFSYLRLIQLIP